MLDYNEIKERTYIVLDGEPYEVVSSHIFRKQQRKPVNSTKLKNMISGRAVEKTFGVSETVEEAEIGKKKIKYIFKKFNRQSGHDEYWFNSIDNSADRFPVSEDLLGNSVKFLKENMELNALTFDEKIIKVVLPIKIELKVTEAPPSVRGSTVSGGDKVVTLETGVTVTVPLFISEGDVLRINTETGEYVERV